MPAGPEASWPESFVPEAAAPAPQVHVPVFTGSGKEYFRIWVINLLLSLATLGWVTPSIATHALTVGAIGSMTIGMMTRTARGHTGRPLQAGAAETAMFALMQLAALARVGGGIFAPSMYATGVQLSGLAWSIAFGLYAATYWPVLTRPRIDGRPG